MSARFVLESEVACCVSTPITSSHVSLTLTNFPTAGSQPSRLTLASSPSTQTGAEESSSSWVKNRPSVSFKELMSM